MTRTTSKLLIVQLTLILGLFVAFSTASADTATIDFESPDFSVGNINGQQGWSKAGGYDHAVSANALYPEMGDQSLRISNAVTSGSFGDQTISSSLSDAAGESGAEDDGLSASVSSNYFEANLDFASAAPGIEQTGLTLNISPDRGDGARMSYVGLRDTAGGLEVFFYDYVVGGGGPDACDGTFPLTVVSSGLARNEVHDVKIQMWFVDGPSNDIVKVTVDGVDSHTGTSWEDYFTGCESKPTRTVDSLIFLTRGTAMPATSGAGFYIDNIDLTTEEPDTDGDGLTGAADLCPNTDADSFPKFGDKQAKNRWMYNGSAWVTSGKAGTQGGFAPTIAQTKGCSGEQILDMMSELIDEDLSGHYKFGLSKSLLEAWIAGTYHVGPTLVETVTVDASDADGSNSSSLENGANYFLRASGTADAGDGILLDAQYSFRTSSSVVWTDAVSTYESYGTQLLDLFVNSADVDWGAYNAAHQYEHTVTGTGAPVNLTIYDVYYPNNTGSLSVAIFKDLWVDLW